MRNYFLLLSVFFLVAVFMSIDGVAPNVVIFTAGLGLPLIFAASIFIYFLCLLPVVVLWKSSTLIRLAGVVVSGAAVCLLTVMPGKLAYDYASNSAKGLSLNDITPSSKLHARSLEIRRNSKNPADIFLDDKPCGAECTSLLLGGEVDWLRVTMMDGDLYLPASKRVPITNVYTLGEGEQCSVLGFENSNTRKCVLLVADTGKTADLVLQFEEKSPETLSGSLDTKWYQWKKWRRVTAYDPQDDSKTLFSKHQAEIDVIMIPFLLEVGFSDNVSKGIDAVYTNKKYNPVSLVASLNAIGFKLDGLPYKPNIYDELSDRYLPRKSKLKTKKKLNWKDGIDEGMTRNLLSVLNLPQKDHFNVQQRDIIHSWISHARRIEDWTPELTDLLRRLINEDRMRANTDIGRIIIRNADLTRRLLPDILTAFEAIEENKIDTILGRLAYTVSDVDPELLKPHAGRIILLMRRNNQISKRLFFAIGRIGVNPEQYIRTSLENKELHDLKRGLAAACYSEKVWAQKLIPIIRPLLSLPETERSQGLAMKPTILKTLAKLGDIDFVKQELSSGKYGALTRTKKEIASGLSRSENSNFLCF